MPLLYGMFCVTANTTRPITPAARIRYSWARKIQQIVKKILHLSLADQVQVDEVCVEYNIHPLVHERIFDCLSLEEKIQSTNSCIELLSKEMPLISSFESDVSYIGCQIIAPHAERLCKLILKMDIEHEAAGRLLEALASFQHLFKMPDSAASLAIRALHMCGKMICRDDSQILRVRDLTIDCLIDAGRYEEALAEADISLGHYSEEEVKSQMESKEFVKKQNGALEQPGTALFSLFRTEEYEQTMRQLILNSNEDDPQWPKYQLDLSGALLGIQKLKEAEAITSFLLEHYSLYDDSLDKKHIRPDLYLTLLARRAAILHAGLKGVYHFELPEWQEVFDLYQESFNGNMKVNVSWISRETVCRLALRLIISLLGTRGNKY